MKPPAPKCTAFFALAVDFDDDVDFGKQPGTDGVIPGVAWARVPSNNCKGRIDLPIHAVRNVTKAEFIDLISRLSGQLYDSLSAAPDAETKPLSNLAADPRIRSHLAKVSQSLMTSDPHPPGEESK